MYLAVSRTPQSVDLAVSRDLPILTSFSTPEADNLGLFSLYSERSAALGKEPQLDRMPYFRFVYLDEDEKEAREYPRKYLTWVRDLTGHRRTLTHGDEIDIDLDHWRRIRTEAPRSYESELEDTAYFGTPEECVRRIKKLEKGHNVGYFGASMSFGSMEHSKVLRSMELFAKQVMPAFR